MTLTVHLRKVKRGELLIAAHAVSEATRSYRMRGEIVVRPGKEAFEIRPSVEWDKGKTVLWLLERALSPAVSRRGPSAWATTGRTKTPSGRSGTGD